MNTTNNLFDQYSGIYGHMVNSFKFINRIPSQITLRALLLIRAQI